MMTAELVTQSELARRLGVSRQYVYKLVKQGKIQRVDGKIDFAAASEALKGLADPARPRKSTASAPEPPAAPSPESSRAPTFAEAKTMKEVFNAKLARLRFEEESGKLIEREEIEDKARDIAVIVKESLLAIPNKLMEQLAAESDPREVHVMLDREMREILSEMANEIRRR
jgi:transcriptional regulator with XRE-family HTH domain